ncbi:MAG: nicotinamide riboside transporter PnuC [Muribaculaceae bacterium]|nr:nicotinamide riboside transporter PnuC [Muribaculaceae bacterium]
MPIDKILEILGFSIGLLYLWWEYHADRRMWYASMVMPAISMWIYFSKGIYADFAINIYYLVIAIYGFIVWTRGHNKTAKSDSSEFSDNPTTRQHENLTTPITSIPPRMLFACVAVFLALWVGLYLILNYLTDSTVPIPDAFTTALSIVGMWMLARKYLQQWIAWILVDAVCTCLYWYKGIPLYAILYAIYTVIAFFGYRKWLRLMHQQETSR